MQLSRRQVAMAAALTLGPGRVRAQENQPPSVHAGHGGHALGPMPAIYGGQADKPGAPIFHGLGAHRHPISTQSGETQRFFDQGINLLFGFNHAEAIRSFREGARLDPDSAMCWWGVAFALGSNINLPMQPDAAAPAWAALQNALALRDKASPAERQWIDALAFRYAANPPADRSALDAAFADAMGRLARALPEDLDAQTFYAEAMMDTQPWDYWQLDGATPKGRAAEIIRVLESVIARAPNHPGALHLYIHAVEASTTPERAEAAADRLVTLMPEAGHIVHMPSHIYYRVGRYHDAARVNEQAALVDEQYIANCRAQGFYPAGYYGHNIHFLWTSAEMDGRFAVALEAARRLVRAVDAVETAKGLPLAELFVFTPVVTLLRFGRWDQILAEPAPPPELALDTAIHHYARGFALAGKRDLVAARAERVTLARLAAGDFSKYAPFNVPAAPMAALALALLDGELARTSGQLNRAVKDFQRAQAIERTLPYTEPPYWHQPVSHLLGAALLQSGRAREAEAVYRQSLTFYRRDGWALKGLSMALAAQNKAAEADEARLAFAVAWQLADTPISTSRF